MSFFIRQRDLLKKKRLATYAETSTDMSKLLTAITNYQ